MEAALRRGSQKLSDLTIHTSFIHWRKAQIVALGLKLGIPFERTWSCYHGGATPCRMGDACREREAEFEEAEGASHFQPYTVLPSALPLASCCPRRTDRWSE